MNSSDSWDSLEWLSDARGLLEWTTQLGTRPAMLLVRHSERKVGLSNIDALKVELTPFGHEIAKEFGRRLPKGKKITLLHSPHIRTTQTAERIVEGVFDNGGTVSHMASMDILWGPINNQLRFASLLEEYSFPEIYRRWLDGDNEIEVFEPLDQFLGRLTPYTIKRLENAEPDSVEILITHDLVIDIIQRKYLEIITGAYNLNIPFLGGLGFTKRNGRIVGHCKGSDFPLAASFEALVKERL